MPLTDTSGIVLRTSDWSETSVIVTWFTRDLGKLRTVAKGAHRPKSPFRGKLDLFYLDDIVYVPSRRGELHTLAECYVENPFVRIRERLDLYTAASYCCELVDLATELEGTVPELFELLAGSLLALDEGRITPISVPLFELLALDCLGFRPDPARLDLDPGTRRIVTDILDNKHLDRLRLTKPQLHALNTTLARLIGQQFGRLPKSRRLLAQ
jgi:DNA repair protein RecO (recombination protein O)